jgi:hypothetical protein
MIELTDSELAAGGQTSSRSYGYYHNVKIDVGLTYIGGDKGNSLGRKRERHRLQLPPRLTAHTGIWESWQGPSFRIDTTCRPKN